MRRFLLLVVVVAALVSSAFACLEAALRRVPTQQAMKRQLLESHAEQISTLVVGSSVAAQGINPGLLADSCCNLAIEGQFLDYNLLFLKRYIGRMPHLRTVVLCQTPYVVGAPDGVDSRTAFWSYRDLGIGPEPRWTESLEVLALRSVVARKLWAYYVRRERTAPFDSLGFDIRYPLSSRSDNWLESVRFSAVNYEISDRAAVRRQCGYVGEAARLLARRGVRLYLVLAPSYEGYRRQLNLSDAEYIRSGLRRVASRYANVYYLDHFADPRFTAADFDDGAHLTSDTGAAKFTAILRQEIGN